MMRPRHQYGRTEHPPRLTIRGVEFPDILTGARTHARGVPNPSVLRLGGSRSFAGLAGLAGHSGLIDASWSMLLKRAGALSSRQLLAAPPSISVQRPQE